MIKILVFIKNLKKILKHCKRNNVKIFLTQNHFIAGNTTLSVLRDKVQPLIQHLKVNKEILIIKNY